MQFSGLVAAGARRGDSIVIDALSYFFMLLLRDRCHLALRGRTTHLKKDIHRPSRAMRDTL